MHAGAFVNHFTDRIGPMAMLAIKNLEIEEALGDSFGPTAPRMFGNAGREFCQKYSGSNIGHFAKIGM